MEFLANRRFLAISLGHLTVDIFNSLVPVLLTVLSVPLALSNADIGLIVTAYSFGGSLSQPLFGYLADRFGGRWLALGGVVWLLLFFSLAPLVQGRWTVACIVLAALGSGAYHPQGTSSAAQASIHRAATATAFFFLFGQVGLALGPALGGALTQVAGLRGLWIPAAFGVAVVVLLARTYGPNRPTPNVSQGDGLPVRPVALRVGLGALAVFALMVFLRSSAQAGTTTFIPKFYAEQGLPPASYGILLSAFMFGSAGGGVVGGNLGDFWGRKPTVVVTLLLAAVPLFLYLRVDSLILAWALVALAGALHGASHSIIVVIAQAMLPGRQAFASGLILGFMFTSGAVGAYLVGLAADQVGLEVSLTALALVSLLAGLLALVMPGQPRLAVPPEAPAEAAGELAAS